jgi:N6-L-threonylcarbamoyladenine synthase
MYTTKSGGIIPVDSAEHHRQVADDFYLNALSEAGVDESDIKAIALSNAPGLAPCLLAGMEFAEKKAKELGIPIIPVNHCIAHLEIGRITGAKDPVMLYASGANTQIIAYAAGKYRVFGETLDLGVGNFIDTFARFMGMGFPGGPKVAELADKYKGKELLELPYSIKGMDVSFAGIQTKLRQMVESKKYSHEELCYAMQETVFAMLVEASERALAHTGKKELVMGGGVGCNTRLQEMCEIMCKERGCKFFCPERPLLVDNAAMIAYLGEIMFNKGIKVTGKQIDKLDIDARERTDDVEVKWK